AAQEPNVQGGGDTGLGEGPGRHHRGGRHHSAEGATEGAVQLPAQGEAPAAVLAGRGAEELGRRRQRGSSGATSSMNRRMEATVCSWGMPPKFIQQITDRYPTSWRAVRRSTTSLASPAMAT